MATIWLDLLGSMVVTSPCSLMLLKDILNEKIVIENEDAHIKHLPSTIAWEVYQECFPCVSVCVGGEGEGCVCVAVCVSRRFLQNYCSYSFFAKSLWIFMSFNNFHASVNMSRQVGCSKKVLQLQIFFTISLAWKNCNFITSFNRGISLYGADSTGNIQKTLKKLKKVWVFSYFYVCCKLTSRRTPLNIPMGM